MPLSIATLESELQAMEPTDDVAVAAARFAKAWKTYFLEASVSGVPIGGSIDAAEAAMKGAMIGTMNVPGAGALAISAGIGAFWGVIASPVGLTLWTVPAGPITLITPPPTVAALVGMLAPVFIANTVGALSKADAIKANAAVFHPNGGIGGIATVTTGGGPVTFPIL